MVQGQGGEAVTALRGHNETIDVGIIGYGLSGRSFHAPLIASVAGLRLTAVVTGNAERAAQVRADHPGVALFDSADALFAAGVVDVVVIASPNRTHVGLAESALLAGCAVVVDKPLAPTAEEARRLIDLARERQLLLTVFHNRRQDGDFRTVRRLVATGTLGTVMRFESRFERWRPTAKPGWRRSGDPAEAGGLLYDLGTHLIDQALVLFGPVDDVYAELERRRPGAQMDEDTFVALHHTSGVRSHLWMSELAAQPGPRFRVLGTNAAYTKFGMDVQEARLRAGERPGASWGEEPEASWGRLGKGDEVLPVRTEAGAYPAFYEGLLAALRDGAPVPVDAADAVAGLEIIETAQRSALHGARTEIVSER
ncbi:MAG: Gfo/Idh/MocA family protein [Longimicrobiales bacterium]